MNDLTLLLLKVMVLSFFLLLGVFFRAKIKIFQKLFIPAPIIGGTIGLLLGPLVMGDYAILPFSDDWIKTYTQIPGVIITPVMAASVFGIHFCKKQFTGSVRKQWGYMVAFVSSQYFVGALIGIIVVSFTTVYSTFGLELFAGFSGGHGTAGIYGQILDGLKVDWWVKGQGLAVASATVGVLFGVIFGMFLINLMARKGEIKHLQSPNDLPKGTRVGISKDPSERKNIGHGVTSADTLDPIAYTFALIAIPSVVAIVISFYSKKYSIPLLQDVGSYAWAVVFAALIWNILERVGLGWILDINTRNRLAGTFVDFLIVSAIISLPVASVLELIVPFSILMIAGFISAVGMFFVGKWVFTDYWFERSIMSFGQCTGVSATGVLLLRIVDPDFKTPALSAWGFAYVFSFPVAFVFLGICSRLAMNYGMLPVLGISALFFVLGIVAAKIK